MATYSLIPAYAGHLELTVVSARGLAAKEGKADPYVVVHVVSPGHAHLAEPHGKTKVLKKNTSPQWDEQFSFDFGETTSHDDVLHLEVWDWNAVLRDKFLGQADLPLVPGGQLQEGIEVELQLKEHEGKHKKEHVSGTLTVTAKLTVDYHRLRAEREAKEKADAAEQKEKEQSLISQVLMTHETAEALIAAFKKASYGSSAAITRSSFKQVFEALDSTSKTILQKQIADNDALFDCLDINHDGQLDLEELLFGISTLTLGSLDDKAELIFKAMDVDNSGSLDKAEVKRQFEKLFNAFYHFLKKAVNETVYKKYHQTLPDYQLAPILDAGTAPLKKQLTQNGVDFIFAKGDTDGDNTISLDEWRALVKENEMAQWLVSPQIYVNKVATLMAPKIAALLSASS